ncbi:hypothetical protein DZG00_05475 [Clavibacter lycopersici]|uniref:Uncharacterized protein n=1 Tax=Clavibacter lycopersici TaxID=2301718 RepID=A0A399T7K2_9MICO|nr:hypothetical protein [Clavibacter lycopersici]RIJ52280.1 hypothetical protein DZG00_05475 [Clavibacter lycopersici]RIJ62528.1 hypothetical protein DZG02_01350 [Clavibacter lycopersici]
MTASNVLRTVVIIAAGVGGIAFWLAGEAGLGTLLLLAALAATFLMGPAILGDPAGIGRLPDGVTAADVKEHRKQHGGSISDAVRAVGQREG